MIIVVSRTVKISEIVIGRRYGIHSDLSTSYVKFKTKRNIPESTEVETDELYFYAKKDKKNISILLRTGINQEYNRKSAKRLAHQIEAGLYDIYKNYGMIPKK